MENTNEMSIEFDSRSCNEGFARVAVAAFCTQLNPYTRGGRRCKTAVSEAITNSIIHGYEGEVHKIRIECKTVGHELYLTVIDHGKGIEDVKRRWNRFYNKTGVEQIRYGICFYGSLHGRGRCGIGARKRTEVHMKRQSEAVLVSFRNEKEEVWSIPLP